MDIGANFVVMNLATMVMLMVAPIFQEVFLDFGANLPWVTDWMFRYYPFLVILPLLSGLVLWLSQSKHWEIDQLVLLVRVSHGLYLATAAVASLAVVAWYLPIFSMCGLV